MSPQEREAMMFRTIKTEESYWKLRSTGLAWELFPDLPNTWEEFSVKQNNYQGGNT